MDKRLTRTEYVFTLIFIFMLVCIVAAFFYGLKIGKETTAEKYERVLKQQEEVQYELTAYHQQHLVSFYHSTFLPFRDFQNQWFDFMNALELRSRTVNVSSVMDEIRKSANKQYQNMQTTTIPDTSPYLQQSHEDYLKSLKLFAEGAKQFSKSANQNTDVLKAISEDVYFQDAIQFALSAQHKYYLSIMEWHKTVNPHLHSDAALDNGDITFSEWESYNIHEKNSLISYLMQEGHYFAPFYLHDMTMRVDHLIQTGQADKMNLKHVQDVVDTLMSTGAVRTNDFIHGKERYYQHETLPQLPFFMEQPH